MTAAAFVLLATLAQAPPLPPADSPAKTQAQALLSEGTALYARGDYTAALAKFEAAYSVYPSPKLQFNIAQADRALGRPVEAVEAFESFLAQVPDASLDLRSEASQAVAELRAKLGRLNIQCPTRDAAVAIDGKVVGITPFARPIWVSPGRHQVAIRHAGYSPITVTAVAGETQTIVVEVTRPLLSVPEVATGSPSTAPVAVSETGASIGRHQDWWSRQRWYFWAAAGGAVAFGAGAIAAGLAANSRFSDLQGSCGSTPAGCTESQIDTVKSRADLANVFWILAAASAVGTGVSLYVENHGAEVAVAYRF
jgi:tetratricopeptide (TPR) repeat protein